MGEKKSFLQVLRRNGQPKYRGDTRLSLLAIEDSQSSVVGKGLMGKKKDSYIRGKILNSLHIADACSGSSQWAVGGNRTPDAHFSKIDTPILANENQKKSLSFPYGLEGTS